MSWEDTRGEIWGVGADGCVVEVGPGGLWEVLWKKPHMPYPQTSQGPPTPVWPCILPSTCYPCCSVSTSIEVLRSICIGVLWLPKQMTTNGWL